MASVEEVRAALERVLEHLRAAYLQVSEAHRELSEAVAILTAASRTHPRSLVPPELTKACDHAKEQLSLIAGGMEAVEQFSCRL
ncbi:hypothetical protein GCM10010174_85160 [Kutzneria viridogrisea]|uniref:Uncharacterized protein n=2 Tax=Kutzneria TaxID=43356 RepID=W5W0C5_9PSEU|nr:hypothetical protein [Kutzneria albida]AHH94016.1 hypothetical protein KALB_641 [Kutzneria albida DSM 43870]MBA8930978.1 putative anti-sigma-YlaC factor YlaD [Kutzneria viridogrisea]